MARHGRSCIRRPRTGGGFTLIELVAVMVIVAVIAATAVPALANLGSTRSGMAARQVMRDITFARQHAVATGTRTWVVFDDAAESWSVLGEDPANPGRAGATVMLDLGTGQPYTTTIDSGSFGGATLTAVDFDGGDEVGFDWLGRPLNDTESDLVAAGAVDLSAGHSITVHAQTGHVEHVAP